MKKVLKVIGIIILSLIGLLIIALIICTINNNLRKKSDKEMLQRDGFCNLVETDGYEMNVNIYGSESPKHTIIAMPGSGDGVFPVHMKEFSKHLGDDIRLVAVSRPGYGVSTETNKDITTEYIVDSTRTALKNAGIEEPYILMPHSFSGIYATYWENTYPDEVEAVLFLDSVNSAYDVSDDSEMNNTADTLLSKLGLIRIFLETSNYKDHTLPDEYAKDYKALLVYNYNYASKSINKEVIGNAVKNAETAWASIKSNDIPKIYISTDPESIEDVYDRLEFRGIVDNKERAEEIFSEENSDEEKEYRKKRSEYIESLGNCEEINIPSDHFVFAHKPDEVVKVLDKLISEIS